MTFLPRWVLFAAVFCHPLRSDDWPGWRGPHRDGISRETNWTARWPAEGPPQLWRAEVGTGFSSVAVAGDRLFTLGNSNEIDTVFAFAAGSGKLLWKHSYPCPSDPKYYEGGPGSTPTVEGQTVYTLSKRGHLFAFAAPTGKVLWQKDLLAELGVKKPEWGFAGSPRVIGELLVLNVGTAGTAVNKHSGAFAWKSDPGLAGYATPVLYREQPVPALAIFSSKALVGVRARDGHPLWQHGWTTRWDINAADPVVVDTKLFISTFDRGCALLELATGTPSVVWANKNLASHFNSCVYLAGHFFGIHGNTDQAEKDLRCLDAATGELKWKNAAVGLGSLIAAGNRLIVLSDRGELIVAHASGREFQVLARAQVLGGKCWTPPVLAHGRIYCRNAHGRLVCLDVQESSPAGKP